MDRNTETPILSFLSGKKSDLDMLIKFIFKTLVSLWFASILRAEKMEKVDQTWKKKHSTTAGRGHPLRYNS